MFVTSVFFFQEICCGGGGSSVLRVGISLVVCPILS